MVLYNLADTYFVGMLGDPIQNAAVTLAAPVMLAFNAVNNLFGVGSSSMMSRALGRRDYDTVAKSSTFGFWCAILSGLAFSLLCTLFKSPLLGLLGADATTRAATDAYMFWTVTCGAAPAILNVVMAYMVRSEGAAMHASIGTMSGCFLNIILDPIFIMPWGLNMGAAGAGLATFLSNCFACLYFMVLLFIKRGRTYVCIDPRKLSFDSTIVGGVCMVGIPAAIQNLLNVTGMTILNNFTSSYGANAVAAMGIAQKINQVPFYIANGLSQGIMPLISYNYASDNIKRMKHTLTFAAKISVTGLVLVSIAYSFFAGDLITMFMDNPEIVEMGSRFLRGFCLGLPFLCVDFLAVGVFQASGLGRNALVFAILRKIVLEIPALFILNHFFPLYGLAYAQFTAELVLSIAAVIILVKLFRKLELEKADRDAQKAQKA
ncbi:MAG: MATE family efflux transporter [Acutalibacteraceae bacterium]